MTGRRDALLSFLLAAALAASGCGGSPEAPSHDTAAPPAPPVVTSTPAPPAADGVARITGRVRFTGAPRPPRPIQVTKDHAVCGARAHADESLLVGKDGGVRNAVVSIGPISPGGAWPESPTPTLDQNGCWFNPHVLLAPAGASIDVVNSDGILHNIHTYPKRNAPTNQAQPKFKKVLNLTFKEPDTVQVKCDVHSWMNAWIIVTPHPYHAVTDENGAFTLSGVPPGSYTLTVWHESLGTREQPVAATSGGTSEATFTFTD
jgi:plastocyanin